MRWSNAQAKSATSQRVRTGRSATDCVPVGSSSSTTRIRGDASDEAATAVGHGPGGDPDLRREGGQHVCFEKL